MCERDYNSGESLTILGYAEELYGGLREYSGSNNPQLSRAIFLWARGLCFVPRQRDLPRKRRLAIASAVSGCCAFLELSEVGVCVCVCVCV